MMPTLESQLRKCPFWIGRTTPYTNSKANRNCTKWTIRNPAEKKIYLFNRYNKHLMSLHHQHLSFDSLWLRYYKSKQSMPRTDAREAIDLSEKKVNSARLMRLRDNQSIIKEMFIPHIVKAICQPEYLVIAAWERKAFGIDDQKPSLHTIEFVLSPKPKETFYIQSLLTTLTAGLGLWNFSGRNVFCPLHNLFKCFLQS